MPGPKRRRPVARPPTVAASSRRRAGGAPSRPPPRPPPASGDQTRERIVAAAVATFARHGLAGTTVRDVARQARIRVSSLYHYFPSKEALYREVQVRLEGELRALMISVLSKDMGVRETCRDMIGRLFDFFLSHRDYARLAYRGNLDDDGNVPDDFDKRWLAFAEFFIKPAEIRGEMKQADPVPLMVTINAMVLGHIVGGRLYRSLLGGGLDKPEIAARVRAHLIEVALRTVGLD
jgi:AcrR family transcriptional regulator